MAITCGVAEFADFSEAEKMLPAFNFHRATCSKYTPEHLPGVTARGVQGNERWRGFSDDKNYLNCNRVCQTLLAITCGVAEFADFSEAEKMQPAFNFHRANIFQVNPKTPARGGS